MYPLIHKANSRGSVSLEHILFISAVLGIAGLVATFYNNIGNYLQNIDPSNSTFNTAPK